MRGIKDTVFEAVAPLVQEEGCELLEVEYVKEGHNRYLRLIIDKAGGVRIGDCERISKRAEKVIDNLDPVSDSYIFEVTSPGIDRPLKTDRDIKRHTGEDVEIRLYMPINGRKSYEGILAGLNEEKGTVILKTHSETREFLKKDISLIKRIIKFN